MSRVSRQHQLAGTTRRRFLAQSAATAVAFSIVKPDLVRGSQANSRINTGVIGLGGRGSWIAKHLQQHAGYQVSAVADYFPEVVDKVGQELNVAEDRRFTGLKGYQRLIDSKVDAVFCETPPYCFPEHVSAAVEGGCHVYMAKPVACDVPGTLQVANMANKAKENKQVFLVDFQTRTDPLYIEAIKRVQAGDLGELGIVDVVCGSEGWHDPPQTDTIESRLRYLIWVNDVELGGGLLVNYDIHAMDVALWIIGQTPVSASGFGRIVDPDAHGTSLETYSVSYQFKNGLIASHRGEHLPNLTDSISCNAYGKVGYLETTYAGKVWIRSNINPYKGGECKSLYGDGMHSNVDTFHQSVTLGNCDNPTVEPSINATLTTILGREAATRKTEVSWDELIKNSRPLPVNLKGLKE
jgi:myo-inositol 2-dehydrogenase / D-chiro-inositol 1-dehydrogenase